MRNLFMKNRVITALLTLSLAAQMLSFASCTSKTAGKASNQPLTAITVPNSYYGYYDRYGDLLAQSEDLIIAAKDFRADGQAVTRIEKDAQTGEQYLVWDNEEGRVSWDFTIQSTGFYYIEICYKSVGTSFADITRTIALDGETPYTELNNITLSKAFTNASKEREYDNRGNELRPTQVLADVWQENLLYANDGLNAQPLGVYLEQGDHSITLIGSQEPIAIREIRLLTDIRSITYKEYADSVNNKANDLAPSQAPSEIRIQGETATLKSSPAFFPIAERDNCYTEPFSLDKTVLNAIGGENWNLSGQWIEWEFDVKQPGYYKLGIRCKQDYVDGIAVVRNIEIDGKPLFAEMRDFSVDYKSGWQLKTLTADDEACRIFLEAGHHVIRMTSRQTKNAVALSNLRTITQDMLSIYEKIVMVTGVSPDSLRDYELPKRIPGLIDSMEQSANQLEALASFLDAIYGRNIADANTIKSIVEQMRTLTDDPVQIAEKLSNYRNNIMQLSSIMLSLSNSPLCIDYISFTPVDAEFPDVNPPFLKQAGVSIQSFVLSFLKDYNSIGNAYDTGDSITVWTMMGRDQADELKVLIDNSFTRKYNINVNMNIIAAESVLLYSTMSGDPPDVALGVSGGVPVDYGLREAAMDLTAFHDYPEVAQRFSPAAIVPFEYEKHVYGLPQAFVFPVMFYRTDVFENLGLQAPGTWEDMRSVIQVLQENSLTAGLIGSYNAAISGAMGTQGMIGSYDSSTGLLGMTIMNSIFFQHGAAYYNDAKTKCLLNSAEALAAFESYTDWFSTYSLPTEYDVYTRFRLGEMPLILSDFTLYNSLTVSAPEIKGLWQMAPLPGTRQPDGSINNAVSSTVTAAVIMNSTKQEAAAWEFLKWWTSAETQTQFSANIEALLGPGGRYNSATLETLEGLNWRKTDLETIRSGIQSAVGVPFVPGSYFTSRHLSNAFWEVVTMNRLPKTTLMKYVDQINTEIVRKRADFGLSAE